MQRYNINEPLVAIRLRSCGESDKAGVMSSLPANAIVEMRNPSDLSDAMVEVSWEHQRYAVFERDLVERATLVQTASVGDGTRPVSVEHEHRDLLPSSSESVDFGRKLLWVNNRVRSPQRLPPEQKG